QNDTERAVCAIWAELLNIDAAKISATANFFELGGHSLLSLKLVAKLNQLGYQVSAKDAIRCTSVQQMAVLLDTAPAYNEVVSSSQIPAGCERITPEHLDLISLSQPQIDALCNQFAGGAANIQDIYPLASLQEGILYHHMLDPDNDPYVSWYLLALQSEAHLPLLLQAIQSVIDEHDILRTGFCWQGLDEPVQVVLRQAQLDVHYLDVTDTADPQQVMTAHLQSDKQSFDLHQAPLMRVTVAQTSEQCIIGVQMHHLIDDAMSLYAIQNQLQDYLEGPAKAQSRTQSRAQSQSGFRAVIAQRQQTQLKDAEAFFTHMLADVEEPSFPFGLTDVTGKGQGMDETSLTLASETSRQIRSLCERHRVSPAALFHSAWAMVLGACCNQPQVVLGTVLSGRMQSVGDAQMILGMLINTLPLKVDLQQSASQVIQQVQRGLMALTSFEHTPLAVATGCSAVATDTPLFSSLINYRHARELHTQDNALRLLDSFERTNYPFSVSVDDFVEQGDFVLSVQIDESVGARRIADYMVQSMRFLLAQLDADDGKPVAVADLLSAPERSQLLQAQRVENPWSELMIHQLFEHQAARNGAAIAIVDGQAELSYEQLNRQANQLAHYLRAQGHVGTDTIIGLCMERSPNMLIALLAVLKAGGAYLPLDPDYPQQRLTYMLEDSQVNLVLCSKACTQTLAGFTGDMVQLDTLLEGEVLQQHSVDNLSYDPSMQAPSALAYAMYTSGSTGQPKGVLIDHQNLTNFALNCETNYGLTGADRMLQFSTMNFDIFVEEWIASLCFGATLVLRNDQVMAGKQGFIAFCQQHAITVASLPTSFWHHLHLNASELAALSLRMIIVGGEALDVAGLEVIAAQQGRCVLMNTYGPTETTITATSLRIDHSTDLTRTITIGKPNPNMAAVVLGQSGQLCPLGVAGELHLGGRGLARGYLGLEQANKEKFVLNQSVNGLPAWASRLYKTGDLVRVNQAGELEFLGRVDEQVKIRGFRVELSEIEHRLMALAGVERALVLANQSHGAQPQLVAYVEFQQHEAAPDSDQLKLLLQAQLPNYMVPSHFVAITDWPLLPSGKVNRKALPAPVSSQSAAPYQAARTETEQQVQQICADLLERPFDTLSVTANFFELGGHSLLVMRLVTRLNDTFAINLAIQDLYQQMTVANISRHIDDVLTLHVSDARTEQSAAVSDLEEFTL
uniref:non-ribosomal peptide synthetase n=1 Tax=Pseudoalteromonas rubra TaxID=43658 RepID=UPI000F7718B8